MKKIIIACSKPKAIKNSQLIEVTEFFKKWISPLSDKDCETGLTNVLASEVVDKKAIYSDIFKGKNHLTQSQIREVVTCHFPKEAKKLLFRYHDYVVVIKKVNNGIFLFDADRLEHSAPIKYNEDSIFYVTLE
jgi:hypothetical protein